MSRLTRRQLAQVLAGGTLAAGGAAALASCSGEAGTSAVLLPSVHERPKPFQVPLPIPTIRRPDRDGRIEVVQREAEVEILPGVRTSIWGYDGTFPGPTLETRSGEAVTVRHTNRLPVPTVVHLHGGHTPPSSDGWPTDLVLPRGQTRPPVVEHSHDGPTMTDPQASLARESRDYRYPMTQRASTLWYHDHRMDFTGPAVWRGLAGFHLIRDDHEDSLSLPHGDRELPLLIADRSFEADGSFRYPLRDRAMRKLGVKDDWMAGVLGDVVLVNGAPWPVHEVDGARHRLRLLNASNARRYRLVLSADKTTLPFVQIGSDGGLLAAPRELDSVTLAPGERADVIVDFGAAPAGTAVTMRNRIGGHEAAEVMRFRVGRRVQDDAHIPARLAERRPHLSIPTDAVKRKFTFALGANAQPRLWVINDEPFRPDTPLVQVPRGRTEVWRLHTNVHHPVHVHLDPFIVLGREELGWKDTLDMLPGETVEIAVRFSDYAGRYVMHCHNLEHEDMAMMARFDVS